MEPRPKEENPSEPKKKEQVTITEFLWRIYSRLLVYLHKGDSVDIGIAQMLQKIDNVSLLLTAIENYLMPVTTISLDELQKRVVSVNFESLKKKFLTESGNEETIFEGVSKPTVEKIHNTLIAMADIYSKAPIK